MQKRVLAGGGIGQFIEFYDFTLYGLSAVTLAKLFFPGGSALAGLLATFATFGVAFFVRPLGGLFFGALGDRIGRRKVLFITLVAIGLATAMIGLLPTYASIGIAAPILLVVCRLIKGSPRVVSRSAHPRSCSSTHPWSGAVSGSTSPSRQPPCRRWSAER